MGQLDGRLARAQLSAPLVAHQQPRPRQVLDHRLQLGGGIALARQLAGRARLAGVPGALAEGDEAQEDAARDLLPRRRQLAEASIGVARHRRPQPAAALAAQPLVGGQREQAPLALLPQLHQRRLQKRQGLRRDLGLAEEALHQRRLEVDPGGARRSHDGGAQRLAAQRVDQAVRHGAAAPQRAGHQLAEKVGAQAQDQLTPRLGAQLAERGEEALARVGLGEGEGLLELIDHHEQAGAVSARGQERGGAPAPLARARRPGLALGGQRLLEPLQRVRAGAQLAHEQGGPRALGELGQEPGAHQRGLARARGADEDQGALLGGEARRQIGELLLAPEQQRGVALAERAHAGIGAGDALLPAGARAARLAQALRQLGQRRLAARRIAQVDRDMGAQPQRRRAVLEHERDHPRLARHRGVAGQRRGVLRPGRRRGGRRDHHEGGAARRDVALERLEGQLAERQPARQADVTGGEAEREAERGEQLAVHEPVVGVGVNDKERRKSRCERLGRVGHHVVSFCG